MKNLLNTCIFTLFLTLSANSQSQFYDTFTFNTGALSVGITNTGHIGSPAQEIRYNNEYTVYSGGFYISGYVNDTLWSGGEFSSAFIEIFSAGESGGDPYDSLNKVYSVRKSDVPFGSSWQEWSNAVDKGALFYDGDGNGVYDPTDKNSNGIWDANEDAPDLIGDITTWCVYNDGMESELRRFEETSPLGIEIHQTLFAYPSDSLLKNMFFIRYRIHNPGNSVPKIDSVLFGIAADADIPASYANLGGCTPSLNSGYTYSKEVAGVNTKPYAVLIGLLQGPALFIPDSTFTDIDSNFSYDEGLDIPLDSSVYRYGSTQAEKSLPGSVNGSMISFTVMGRGVSVLDDPDRAIEHVRYVLEGGILYTGEKLDITDWQYGNGSELGSSADSLNPLYMYSGDPVTDEGWLNTNSDDNRISVNTGPFSLDSGSAPVEIIAVYVIDSGVNYVNAVEVVEEKLQYAKELYAGNFENNTVSALDDERTIPERYTLYQNYPNPFNPSTTIAYSLPVEAKVKLTVYDILGREVKTIVNDVKNAGYHKVSFDGSELSSGVYFYQIKTDRYRVIRKMILLK